MKIRSQNTQVNEEFAKILTERNDLRIGQMIYNALRKYRQNVTTMPNALENALFYLEDEELIKLIQEMLKWGVANI